MAATTALPASSANATLTARLVEFNFLPSRWLHPSRADEGDPARGAHRALAALPRVASALHRRRSATLLAALGEDAAPVSPDAGPALPLALAALPLLARLIRDAGTVLLGRRLRLTVLRAEVVAARDALGADALALARGPAATLHPGLDDASAWLPEGAASLPRAADTLGAGLLARAWSDAAPALRRRADWKLPIEADAAPARAASGLDAGGARDLCLLLLQRIEPAWLSLFPSPSPTR